MATPRLLPQRLSANAQDVVVRPCQVSTEPRSLNVPQAERMRRIVEAVTNLDNRSCHAELAFVLQDFENRHREIRSVFFERFEEIARALELIGEFRDTDKLLIG